MKVTATIPWLEQRPDKEKFSSTPQSSHYHVDWATLFSFVRCMADKGNYVRSNPLTVVWQRNEHVLLTTNNATRCMAGSMDVATKRENNPTVISNFLRAQSDASKEQSYNLCNR
jgi:hypothetical protein